MDLVQSLPDHLIAATNTAVDEGQKQLLSAKMTLFPDCFVEIGSGSGGHLLEQARRTPDSLFVGFELRYKRAFKTAEKAYNAGLENLMVVRTDAALIPALFSPRSINGLYINFPDPWDKKKWQKHRILNEQSILRLSNVLKINGFISYKTDHPEYFETTRKLFSELPMFTLSKYTEDLHNSPFNNTNIQTEFEKLFISKGLPSYMLEAQKIS